MELNRNGKNISLRMKDVEFVQQLGQLSRKSRIFSSKSCRELGFFLTFYGIIAMCYF